MRLLLPLILLSLVACSSPSSDNEPPDNAAPQRDSMRSDVEGTWTGTYTFTDGRAPTTMTLALTYSGNGKATPQCGTWTLSGGESSIGPRCITFYTLPLRGTITTADGARKDEAASLTYDNIDGISGGVGAAKVKARLQSGHLEGTLDGTSGGSFTLTRLGK
jgi:hypothetical protein